MYYMCVVKIRTRTHTHTHTHTRYQYTEHSEKNTQSMIKIRGGGVKSNILNSTCASRETHKHTGCMAALLNRGFGERYNIQINSVIISGGELN